MGLTLHVLALSSEFHYMQISFTNHEKSHPKEKLSTLKLCTKEKTHFIPASM